MSHPGNYWNNTSQQLEAGQGAAGKPFVADYAWSPTALAFVPLQVDASGSLLTAGGGGGGGAVTVANGADVAEGNTADLAVTTDAAGTLSGKLRGLVKILSSVWDSTGNTVKGDLRRGLTIQYATISTSAAGDTTLVAADATRKIKVLQYTLIATTAVSVIFKSGAATSLTGAMPLAATGGIASPYVAPASGALLETAANQALVINLSGAVALAGHLAYVLEA